MKSQIALLSLALVSTSSLAKDSSWFQVGETPHQTFYVDLDSFALGAETKSVILTAMTTEYPNPQPNHTRLYHVTTRAQSCHQGSGLVLYAYGSFGRPNASPAFENVIFDRVVVSSHDTTVTALEFNMLCAFQKNGKKGVDELVARRRHEDEQADQHREPGTSSEAASKGASVTAEMVETLPGGFPAVRSQNILKGPPGSRPSSACYDVSRHEPRSLEGKLVSAVLAGRPGYDDVRKGDDPEAVYVLQLEKGICVRDDDPDYGSGDLSQQITEIQVYPEGWKLETEAAMRSLIGLRVHVEFESVHSATDGHDHRPLVAGVKLVAAQDENSARTVIPRTLLPRAVSPDQSDEIGTPATTVRAFYLALELGNGEAASSLVVPEKRSGGPFAPENISRFYGPLMEPLRLTALEPQGVGSYRVHYQFRTKTKLCLGRAVVTTTRRDGLNLIGSIQPLDGC